MTNVSTFNTRKTFNKNDAFTFTDSGILNCGTPISEGDRIVIVNDVSNRDLRESDFYIIFQVNVETHTLSLDHECTIENFNNFQSIIDVDARQRLNDIISEYTQRDLQFYTNIFQNFTSFISTNTRLDSTSQTNKENTKKIKIKGKKRIKNIKDKL